MVEERSGTVNKNEKNVENYEEKAVFIWGAGWGSREGVAVGWHGGRLGFGVRVLVRVLIHVIYLV